MAPRPRSTASPGRGAAAPRSSPSCAGSRWRAWNGPSTRRSSPGLPLTRPAYYGSAPAGEGWSWILLEEIRGTKRGPLRGAPGPGGALAGRPPPDERAGADLESAGTGSAPLPPGACGLNARVDRISLPIAVCRRYCGTPGAPQCSGMLHQDRGDLAVRNLGRRWWVLGE